MLAASIAVVAWNAGHGFAGEAALGHATGEPSQQTAPLCVGDCNHDKTVTVDELILGIAISLGELQLQECSDFDENHDDHLTIDELVGSVRSLLDECGRRPTSSPTPTRTETPPPSATPSTTATPTPTLPFTHTPTRTATPADVSICLGTITSVPKLCNVEVVPNPVPLFGTFAVHYCLSDREGDIQQLCLGIRTSPMDPIPNCSSVAPAGHRLNGCSQFAVQSTEAVGDYAVVLYFQDSQGNRSNVAESPYAVRVLP